MMLLAGLFVLVTVASFTGCLLAYRYLVWRQLRPTKRPFWSRVYDR